MNSQKTIGIGMALASGISYGLYGIFESMMLEAGINEETIIALPAIILTLYFGIKVLLRASVLKTFTKRTLILCILQGSIFGTAMNFCYTKAYSAGMPVGVVSIVAFCNVIVVMILSKFILHYNFTIPKFIGVIAAIIGVALVMGIFGENGSGSYTMLGLIFTILIPVCYGINVIINTYCLMQEVNADAVLLVGQGSSLIVALVFLTNPIAVCKDLAANLSGSTAWIGLIGFIIFPMIICYTTMQESLKRIDPTIYQIMMSMDPVVALISSIIIMHEIVTGIQIVGVAILLIAVIFITVMDGRDSAPA